MDTSEEEGLYIPFPLLDIDMMALLGLDAFCSSKALEAILSLHSLGRG